MDIEQGRVPVQPTYTEDSGAAIALHHGSMGHFGVSKTLDSALLSGLNAKNLKQDIIEFIKFCPTCKKMSMYIGPIMY
jgi:hypothetical protein